MPHAGHKVIVVTPAGRRRYLELLVSQVKAYVDAGVVDEYQLWANTADAEDLAYMEVLAAAHSWVTIKRLPPGVPPKERWTIHHFFAECTEEGAVYVRFDDDVVVLDSVPAFKAFLDFRVAHPEYFLCYASVINSAIMTHIMQRHGSVSFESGIVSYNYIDALGWGNPQFAASLHDQVLAELAKSTSLERFRPVMPWIAYYDEPMSINAISWLGAEFKKFGGVVAPDEEIDLACELPKKTGKHNAVFGGFCCVHFAFYTQREHLEAEGYLDKYREHVESKKVAAKSRRAPAAPAEPAPSAAVETPTPPAPVAPAKAPTAKKSRVSKVLTVD